MASGKVQLKLALLDTNVVLDVLLQRTPWYVDAVSVWRSEEIGCHLSATSVTDIFYVVRKLAGVASARKAVQVCLSELKIVAIDEQILHTASKMPENDFEDNVQIASAQQAGLDVIITRDKAGFRTSPIQILTPNEVLERINQEKGNER